MRIGIIGGRGWIAGMFKECLDTQKIEFVDLRSRGESQVLERELLETKITHLLYVARTSLVLIILS
jgi:hypothetical protein